MSARPRGYHHYDFHRAGIPQQLLTDDEFDRAVLRGRIQRLTAGRRQLVSFDKRNREIFIRWLDAHGAVLIFSRARPVQQIIPTRSRHA
jgi:hypothetical protein